MITRRGWIAGLGSIGVAAAGAKALDANGLVPPDATGIFAPERTLSYAAHRLLAPHSMAREFPRSAISEPPFPNGKPAKEALAPDAPSTWRLEVGGLVANPITLSLADLRAMPRRSQVTALACEEGWSYVAEWIGVPLAHVLREAGVKPEARYVAYFSVQPRWWDSIDMNDALHPQTFLAYGMNGGDLPPGHGGPMRIRVPRQLGYKSVKFVTKLTLLESVKGIGKGMGSNAAERGYSWFNGI
ncbi:MAG: molybdopterin-dependent oxidoreductase [Bryobacterales bacterium]|nr:molybdopterin-dependent oxidoreductase [Bryobacterales bacterium]